MKKVSKEIRDARKKQTAEVFTPKPLVREILRKLPKDVWEPGKTFCDPSAGNGNFLVEVLKFKVLKYKHDPLEALSTIYGVELMPDNVQECRSRLAKVTWKMLDNKNKKNMRKIVTIIKKNIVCHDALTYDYKFE